MDTIINLECSSQARTLPIVCIMLGKLWTPYLHVQCQRVLQISNFFHPHTFSNNTTPPTTATPYGPMGTIFIQTTMTVCVCMCVCIRSFTYEHCAQMEGRGQYQVSFSVTPPFMFWDITASWVWTVICWTHTIADMYRSLKYKQFLREIQGQ